MAGRKIDPKKHQLINRPWWPSGLRPYLKFKQRECLRSQVRIPARDYNFDCSESEMACHYSNRAPGDMCRLQYLDKALKPIWILAPNQEPSLELHSRAAPSVEAHHRSVHPEAGRNSGGRRIKKNHMMKIRWT